MKSFQLIARVISLYYPLWILGFSTLAYFLPNAFLFLTHFAQFGLGFIFLLMGLTLSFEKLQLVVKHPKYALIGVFCKWTIMVSVSIGVAYLFFSNEPEIATGFILAGTVPSGTSANIYTLIAGGELALSITMATADTLIAPLLTPSLVQFFAGQFVPIEFWPMFLTILSVVLLPLSLGLFIQWKWPAPVAYVKSYTSIFSQLSLLLVIISVVANAHQALQAYVTLFPLIIFAVILQTIIPMAGGYLAAKVFRVREDHARAILFHTGICNTALAATLAMEHISPLAAIPAVISLVVNLSIGAWVANIFASKYPVLQEEHVTA